MFLRSHAAPLPLLPTTPKLVRLLAEKKPEGDYLEPLEEYPNLGPIVDFTVLDLHKHGQSQVATCSGAFKVRTGGRAGRTG